MKTRTIGDSGLSVSAISLGCNNFGMRIGKSEAAGVVTAALDEGITMFDTADVYADNQSEEILGEILGDVRHEVVLATKFGIRLKRNPPDEFGASRRYIIKACEDSLRRLRTDYIDLYYLHKPDPRTPMEETLSALDRLVRQGKVRYIASSNLSAWQIVDADHIARAKGTERFVGAQNEWSLLQRGIEREIVPACDHCGVGIIPYFPLASGLLTGKYRSSVDLPKDSRLAALPQFGGVLNEANLMKVERLADFAEKRDRSILELSISWLAGHDSVSSVLIGATKPEQVVQNVAAADWELTAEERNEVDQLLEDG